MLFVDLYKFIDLVGQCALTNDIIVPSSSGQASEIVLQAWKVKQGQRIITLSGLGSMGFALPMAIGASIADPNRRVICFEGDGSLQHNIQELETLRRLNLNVKLFVLNNNGYASIRNTHKKFFNSNPVNDLTFPDLEKIANAYGIKYYRYEGQELDQYTPFCIDDFYTPNFYDKEPAIFEVMIDPNFKREVI